MTKRYFTLLFVALSTAVIVSCSSDDDETAPGFRAPIDYSLGTSDTSYSKLFVDDNGATTVDLKDGNQRLKMFQALNYYSSSSVTAGTAIDAEKLSDLFSNTGDPFVDISTSTISVVGAELNASDLQLRNTVATSFSSANADAVRNQLEDYFEEIDMASASLDVTAEAGVAGILTSASGSKYLVDERGLETAQLIQKSLIGALQLDYISNVLLDEGLSADNTKLVEGKNYTALEHTWDVAYGLLTLNQIYLKGSTDAKRGTTEFALGSYIWEYNKADYAKIYPAFLKGRIAIVNDDMEVVAEQATFIRTAMEKAIAKAALGYLGKWKTETNEGSRAHAIGEGLGFIYSLRFANIHGGTTSFSDDVLDDLIGSEGGYWDLEVGKINDASDAIETKFGL